MILPCVDGEADFPSVDNALNEPDGLLCFGGDLSIERLMAAYSHGIFPWYTEGEPILWWSPSKRMVLLPNDVYVSSSFRKALNKTKPKYFFNRNFRAVINHCAKVPRKDQGTWIHEEMIDAYCDLFDAGKAFCLEVEIDGHLAGGIYGVTVNKIFCGESMFSLVTNGSKYAMYGLCQHMLAQDIKLLDCQLHNPHLATMGAHLIPRSEFLSYLD